MAGNNQLWAAVTHAAGQGVGQRLNGAARHAEDILDTDLLQVVDDQIAAFQFGGRRK